MKLFKKIFVPMLAAICVIATCAMFAACGDTTSKYAEEDDDTNWDYTTYIVYLQLPDGTPVENVAVEICSDGTGGGCNPATTNEDGRVSVSFSSSREGCTTYVHFTELDSGAEYEGPEGYTLPADSHEFSGYSHVWYLTQKVTTLTFIAES